jgi:hypothetical protein
MFPQKTQPILEEMQNCMYTRIPAGTKRNVFLKIIVNGKLQLMRPTYYENWTLGKTRPLLTLAII